MTFSVIIPVYNRRDEVEQLLESLARQTCTDFEVVITEDGSTDPCQDICERYAANGLDVKYFFKPNEGRSIARNHSMAHAQGSWMVFFDSDCVIPSDYFDRLSARLAAGDLDCFGGPDAAHASFSTTQKAINFAMTSFLTTGGIRGGKHSMEKFTPRTFNMGFTREVYNRVGGFREMFSEDIDMSKRIEQAGFRIGLVREAAVYHKRRVNLRKFFRQVYVFGMSRITLMELYPGSLKLVHALPALFVLFLLGSIVAACFGFWWPIAAVGFYTVALFCAALIATRSLIVSLKAVPASFIQLIGYGLGFLKAFTQRVILRRRRNIADEVAIRKGK